MEYKYINDFKRNIFREYDVRGVYPTDLNEDLAYTFGLGFGTHIQKLGKKYCVVGHDNRISSPSLYNALIQGIKETGVEIICLGLCTTPMYYYACIKLGVPSGVMVTASHNPKEDNGFKFAFDEKGNCKGEEIQAFAKELTVGEFIKGEGKISTYNIENDYLELFKKSLKFGNRKVKVVVDTANGTTSNFCRKIYEQFPIDLIIINEESDGNFPNHHPDPSVETNLEQLKKKVVEEKALLGLSFDGDGDRLGVVTHAGQFIPMDLYMIIIIRDLVKKGVKKEFLYDIKCSKSLIDEIEKLDGKGICYRTGNSYTKAKVREADLPFGGEYSGHVYFRDRWPGFDSGMYAGLRLLEILSYTNKNINQLLTGINEYYSTDEIKIPLDDYIKFKIINRIEKYAVEKGYNYNGMDGIRVNFDDGWALVRASNTGPNLTLRFEAKTEERLKEIGNEFMEIVNKNMNNDTE